MEGVLWKWTNYFSGWQPRWFVLDNGVLSYYKSQDDVNNGCKGSIKMAVCDIVVHQSDATRLDLIIPGEQHYYVKAATTKERQEWLVALGSDKANRSGRFSESEELSPDSFRSKKSELRLYCDLLMQQVHSVKQIITSEEKPNAQKLDETTTLLSATCDTFIQTLEDCMQLAKHNANPIEVSPVPPSPTRANRKGSKSFSRSNSVEKVILAKLSPRTSHDNSRNRTSPRSGSEDSSVEPETNGTVRPRLLSTGASVIHETNFSQSVNYLPVNANTVNRTQSPVLTRTKSEDLEDFKDAIDSKIPTFFSVMKPSFTEVVLLPDNGIPIEPFLGACRSLVPIFDKLNGTAFAPVKMDFAGNIKKIQQKYSTHPGKFESLQNIVEFEVQAKHHTNSNSATVAMLWLKRGLQFVLEFLREFCSGELDLGLCASSAYSRSLRPYHGWVVRGVFAVAVKALPYREVFTSHLAEVECSPESPLFQHSLSEDIENYIHALSSIITIIEEYYCNNDLDMAEQV